MNEQKHTEKILLEIAKEMWPQGDSYQAYIFDKYNKGWLIRYSNDYPMQHGDGKKLHIPIEIVNRLVEVSALREKLGALREAVANYMKSEGCSCCRDYEAHVDHKKRLGELLDVAPYSDGSGHDFTMYQSK